MARFCFEANGWFVQQFIDQGAGEDLQLLQGFIASTSPRLWSMRSISCCRIPSAFSRRVTMTGFTANIRSCASKASQLLGDDLLNFGDFLLAGSQGFIQTAFQFISIPKMHTPSIWPTSGADVTRGWRCPKGSEGAAGRVWPWHGLHISGR